MFHQHVSMLDIKGRGWRNYGLEATIIILACSEPCGNEKIQQTPIIKGWSR